MQQSIKPGPLRQILVYPDPPLGLHALAEKDRKLAAQTVAPFVIPRIHFFCNPQLHDVFALQNRTVVSNGRPFDPDTPRPGMDAPGWDEE